jgi:N-sulfoglucosamine sulfohydrolase
MKQTLIRSILGASALFAGVACAAESPRPPNILLITADDMGMTAGCYGDSQAITPNLDRLAAEGVRFSNAYITQSSCSPSRSSILTGLYPHQNGQVGLTGFHPLHGAPYAVHPGTPTLPNRLRDAGYRNCILGKLHVEPAAQFVFDEYPWRDSLGKPELTRDVRKMAELAGTFMNESADEPFFLYVNYFDPHRPYNDEANQCSGLPERPYAAKDVQPCGFLGDAADLSQVAAYYNCVNRMDVGLGLLFDQLRQSGKYDNTLIVFLSDNGPDFTRAKTTCYEAGVRVPFLVKWPGVSTAGLVCRSFISSVDLMPTLLDAAGASCPPVEGRSLREVVQGKTPADWPDTMFTEYTAHVDRHFYPRRAIRGERFKLIHDLDSARENPVPHRGFVHSLVLKPENRAFKNAYFTAFHPPEWELYDLTKDPHETVNLIGNPEYADELKILQTQLTRSQEKTGDPMLDPDELSRLHKLYGISD